jgi:hypothetical protein
MHVRVHVKLTAIAAAIAALALPAAASADATSSAWQRISVTTPAPLAHPEALLTPKRFAAFRLDLGALRGALSGASGTVAIPSPDGSLQRFAVTRSAVMTPKLAKAHPEIRTYAGRGIDDPTATVRLDTTPLGFHASVRSDRGSWFVDPQFAGSATRYAVYARGSLPKSLNVFEEAGVEDHAQRQQARAAAPKPQKLKRRNYRLALVTDPTYAQNSGAADGLDPADPKYAEKLNARVTAAKVTLMNRVNQLYEADFDARMLLIGATDRLNLNTAALATGPNGPCGVEACFTEDEISTCGSGTLDRNDFVAGMIAGARNFDIGHIGLGTNGGGIAALGVVGTAFKSEGCTGIPKPIGDYYAVDYVAHEMGHEFGGNHTFNGTQRNCSSLNRNLTGETTVEPGSGITVMAYAGICGQDDLQAHSDPYFSQSSIDEMGAYMASAPDTLSSVQQVALLGFDGTDSFRLSYSGERSAPIARGTNYTTAGIKTAIESIKGWPAGATVTVKGFNGASSLGDDGFQVAFGGTLAGKRPAMLAVGSAAGATGFVGETVAGGPEPRGGSTVTTTGNHFVPEVSAPDGFTIPVRTPFTLTASGSDGDGEPLTYLWEQNDPGPPIAGTGLVDNNKTNGPLFRTFGTRAVFANPDDTYLSPSPGENLATGDPSRTFPDIAQVIADNTNAATGICPPVPPSDDTPVGSLGVPEEIAALSVVPPTVTDCYSEFLPTPQWVGVNGDGVLHFRVTARDNHPGGGAISHADTALTLAQAAGPFRVLTPAGMSTAVAGQPLPVTWDVARTDVLTGTPDVRIALSADGGQTFPYELAASTANDGSQTVTLPAGVRTDQGVIRVEGLGNVFFDVSHGLIKIN